MVKQHFEARKKPGVAQQAEPDVVPFIGVVNGAAEQHALHFDRCPVQVADRGASDPYENPGFSFCEIQSEGCRDLAREDAFVSS